MNDNGIAPGLYVTPGKTADGTPIVWVTSRNGSYLTGPQARELARKLINIADRLEPSRQVLHDPAPVRVRDPRTRHMVDEPSFLTAEVTT
jgi:hypothetical protein